MIYNKLTGQSEVTAYSNYSYGLFADQSKNNELVKVKIDYSQVIFTKNPAELRKLANELGAIACQIEEGFGGAPQDIEGALEDGQIFIVQSRNQV